MAPARPVTRVPDVFTGLVQALGEVCAVVPGEPGVRLTVRAKILATAAAVGDSVSVNGCCLTVVAAANGELAFDAGPETLRLTNLGRLRPGDPVNLEPALRAGDPLGGHLVTGHIDGLGTVDAHIDDGDWCTMWFRAAPPLLRQMAPKGSVTVDGVSLTLVAVEAERFSVALIPHTLASTTLGRRAVGDEVNLETDILAKYVERQLAGQH